MMMFCNEIDALWNDVITRKCGEEEGGWSSCEVMKGFAVGLWTAIRR